MNQKTKIYHCFIVATASLIIPLLYIHQTAGTVNPFHLNGKQFLYFFSLLTATSAITGFIWMGLIQKQYTTNDCVVVKRLLPQPKHCIVLVLVIGLARLAQGISNHKPVGYLVLLLLLNLAIFLLIQSRKI